MVILQVGDRSWRVNFLVHSKPYSASICGGSGWTAFSQENCLDKEMFAYLSSGDE